jgi:hypothetical protein
MRPSPNASSLRPPASIAHGGGGGASAAAAGAAAGDKISSNERACHVHAQRNGMAWHVM